MNIIGIILIIAAFIFSMGMLIFIWHDYKEQKNHIEGANYRREHGRFDFDDYIKNNNLIKNKDWLKE